MPRWFRSLLRRMVDWVAMRVLAPSLDKLIDAQIAKTVDSAVDRRTPALEAELEKKLESAIERHISSTPEQVIFSAVEKRIEPTLDRIVRPALDRHEQQLAPQRILENRYLAAKMINPLAADTGYVITPNKLPGKGDGWPTPPGHLWEGYGETEEEYLDMGRQHVNTMGRLLAESGADLQDLKRVMDFGCAAGRMLRFMPRTHELWGCDIKADSIDWCQQHLPFNFLAITTFPHLPFEDNYFDLVYAGSVFTHIIDLPDAWLLELRRIVRKGGYLYITVQDKHSLELAFTKYADRKEGAWYLELLRKFDERTQVFSQDFGCFSFEGGVWGGLPVPQVFYDTKYLTRKWSGWVNELSATEEAYGYQTALLFQKP